MLSSLINKSENLFPQWLGKTFLLNRFSLYWLKKICLVIVFCLLHLRFSFLHHHLRYNLRYYGYDLMLLKKHLMWKDDLMCRWMHGWMLLWKLD